MASGWYVACRQLGFPRGAVRFTRESFFGLLVRSLLWMKSDAMATKTVFRTASFLAKIIVVGVKALESFAELKLIYLQNAQETYIGIIKAK